LKVLQILSLIIFIGLFIEGGGIVVNTFITMFVNPDGVKNFWEGAHYLSSLYLFDKEHFFVITLAMIIVVLLKAIMFYFTVKLLTNKKLNISQPFKTKSGRLI